MVAFDAVGPSAAGTSGAVSPLTWLHVNAGNALVVGVTCFSGTANNVTAVTYGGVALSFLKYQSADNVGPGGVSLYGLVSGTLPTGSNTVSVSFSVAENHNAGSVSLTGAGSLGAAVAGFASGTSGSAVVPGTTPGGVIVSAASFGSNSGVFSATSPNVLRWSLNTTSNSGADNGTGGTDPSAGGSQTVAWANTASDFWAVAAVEVLPPASPAPPPAPAFRPVTTRYRSARLRGRWVPRVQPPGPAAGFSVSDSDVSAGADGPEAVSAALADSDASPGADAGTAVGLGSAESGSAADGSEAARLASSDSSPAADGPGAVSAALSSPDSSAGADAAPPPGAALASADAGAAAEQDPAAVRLASPDAAAGADAGEGLRLASSDSSPAADGPGSVLVSGSDASPAADGSEAARVSDADASPAADGSEAAALADSDSSPAADGAGQVVLPGPPVLTARPGPAWRARYAPRNRPRPAVFLAAALVPGPADSDASPAADGAEAVSAALSSADAAAGADGAEAARVSGSDASPAADGAEAAALSSADSSPGADGGTGVLLSAADSSPAAEAAALHQDGSDASPAADAGGTLTAALSGTETAPAADAASQVALAAPGDAAGSTDAHEGLSASVPSADAGAAAEQDPAAVRLASAEASPAADDAPSPATHNVSDSDGSLGEDSEIAGVPPGADGAAAAEAGEALAARLRDSESCRAADAAPPAGGTWVASGSDASASAEAQYWSGPLSSADASAAAEAEQPRRPVSDADSAPASDDEHEQVRVDAFVPLNRWTGGGFAAPAPPRHAPPAEPLRRGAPQPTSRARTSVAAGAAVAVSLDIRKLRL